jgi:hypothetical protein
MTLSLRPVSRGRQDGVRGGCDSTPQACQVHRRLEETGV